MGLDPVTAVANAITAGCNVGIEYLKFLQTPVGQDVAKQQLEFGNRLLSIGDKVSGLFDKLADAASKAPRVTGS